MAAGNSMNWTLFFKGQNKLQQIPVLKVILMQTLNALLLLLNWNLKLTAVAESLSFLTVSHTEYFCETF